MEKFSINDTAMVAQAVDLVATDMDGEIVMMSISNGKYYGLDAIGSRIWELLGVQRSVSELVSTLVAEYNVEQEQCYDETIQFLQYLLKEGLIRVD